jgi:hypothetical protein
MKFFYSYKKNKIFIDLVFLKRKIILIKKFIRRRKKKKIIFIVALEKL